MNPVLGQRLQHVVRGRRAREGVDHQYISDDMVKEYRQEMNDTAPRSTSPLTYDRKQFGNWIDADRDCQDTRQEVLIEESRIPVTFKTARQCRVLAGE